MKKIFLFCFSLLLFSCGWLDPKENVTNLINDFKIINEPIQNKSNGYQLVLGNENSYQILVSNCLELYYNESYIYVKSNPFGNHLEYSKIIFPHKKTTNIELKEYNFILNKCDNCIRKEFLLK